MVEDLLTFVIVRRYEEALRHRPADFEEAAVAARHAVVSDGAQGE